MADPSVIPGMPRLPPDGVSAYSESVGERVLVNDEDILSPQMKSDIEGFATPFAWGLVAILVVLWLRRFSKDRSVDRHAK